MATHSEIKKQQQAASEALKIKRGERTMDNASPMAQQLCYQYGESFIRSIAMGEFVELVSLKPLPKIVTPTPSADDVIDMDILETEVTESPDWFVAPPTPKVVTGKITKKARKKKSPKKQPKKADDE